MCSDSGGMRSIGGDELGMLELGGHGGERRNGEQASGAGWGSGGTRVRLALPRRWRRGEGQVRQGQGSARRPGAAERGVRSLQRRRG